MENSVFSVDFYETLSGDCPVEDFIKSQNIKMRAKIYRTLELLEERGNSLRMPPLNIWTMAYSKFVRKSAVTLLACCISLSSVRK